MKKAIIITGSAVGVLLAALIILVAVLIHQNSEQAKQADLDRANAICTQTVGPLAHDLSNLDEYTACLDRTYGKAGQ